MAAEAAEGGRVGGQQCDKCRERDRGDRDEEAVPHPAGQRLVQEHRAQRSESRMRGKTSWVELVLGVRSERRRDHEPQRVQRGQADDDEEPVPSQRTHEARSLSWPYAGSTRPCWNCDGSIEPLASVGSHVVRTRLRTKSDNPIRTLAMPSSITATLAAVPFAPFEKLRQMYSSITLDA